MTFDDQFTACVVYNPPHREAVCIEPYTTVPDRVLLAEKGIDPHLQVPGPGPAFRTRIEIRLEIRVCLSRSASMIAHALLARLLSALSLVACARLQPVPPAGPHVLLIMTDDQGWGDFGFHGNPHLKTPHLDRLAAASVELTQFYVSARCAARRGPA